MSFKSSQHIIVSEDNMYNCFNYLSCMQISHT